MRKTFKFRLYPSRAQQQVLEQTLQTCRILYNNTLVERRDAWEKEKRSVSYHEQAVALPKRKESNPFLPLVHSQVLQDVLRRVDRNFKNFFRRAKNGEKPGYPRFKGYWRYDSFIYPQSGFEIEGRKLTLSKIGSINIQLHRALEGEIKTCTIRRDVDRWYACFSVELPVAQVERHKVKRAVGVDVGLESLVTLSNGEKIEPPKFLRRSEEKLAKEQCRLSQKKKGSQNRIKQRIKVVRLHRRIREQRNDFLHKLSRRLVDSYELIAFEDLRIKNMLGNHRLAKAISDAGWDKLQSLTAYKAEEVGKIVEFVAANGTSQECSNCGAVVHLSLSGRAFRCDCCGFAAGRDHNAAINILRRVGQELPDFKPAGEAPLGASMNQEAPCDSWG